jgi:GNAT superfamily N-acetyltransferase
VGAARRAESEHRRRCNTGQGWFGDLKGPESAVCRQPIARTGNRFEDIHAVEFGANVDADSGNSRRTFLDVRAWRRVNRTRSGADKPMNDCEIFPLTPDSWTEFEQLFGPRGACAGCWCMYWKLKRKDFNTGQGDSNHMAQKQIVNSGFSPGLLARVKGNPAGWVAVEPRENYPILNNSRILKPLDELPVWSVTCFFVAKKFRNQGLTVALLKAVIEHVGKQGGELVEGYPVEPRDAGKMPPVFIYTGLVSAFKQAGFTEAGRRSERRPIMRYYIKK